MFWTFLSLRTKHSTDTPTQAQHKHKHKHSTSIERKRFTDKNIHCHVQNCNEQRKNTKKLYNGYNDLVCTWTLGKKERHEDMRLRTVRKRSVNRCKSHKQESYNMAVRVLIGVCRIEKS